MGLPANGLDALDRPVNDPRALEASREAFAQHHHYLCQTLRRLGARPEDIEDLAQDAFVVMCRRWQDYEPHRPLRAWLAGIAFNVAQKHVARQWREAPAGEVEMVDDTPLPDERLHAARARRLVLAALDSMAPRDRAVLVLHQIDELPMQEVAAALQVPLFTAYTRLRRARLRFAEVVAALQARSPGTSPAPLSARALLALERGGLPRVPPPPGRKWVALVVAGGLAAGLCAALALLPRGPAHRTVARPAVMGSLPASVSPHGLMGYWGFEDGRGSAVARDRSGAGHDCLLRDLDAQLTWMDGALGGGIRLQDGWLECPQAPATLRPDSELSVLAWVKVPETKTLVALVTRQLDQDKRDHFFFGLRDGYLKVRSSLWTKDVNGPQPVSSRRWTHVAFTQSADGTTRLYQDGALVGEAQDNRWKREAQLYTPIAIGAGINGPAGRVLRQHLQGAVDEVAIYSRALGPEEVARVAGTPHRRD